MLKSLVEPIARGRYMLPLVVLFAVLGVLITEATYRRAKATLDGGIALTDARIKSAALLQALTDHEMATKRYLLTGDPGEADRQRATSQAVRRAQQETLARMAALDDEGTLSLNPVRDRIDAQLASIDAWLQQAAAGRRDEALQASTGDTSRIERDAMRSEFDLLLQRAAASQQGARESLYDALMLNRMAIHGLMLVSVLAMLMFVRSLREVDLQKENETTRLAALVEDRTANLRELAGHMVNVREDERAHLARELHDELGGLLTATKLELARLRRVSQMPEAAHPRLSAVDERLNQGIALKRRIIETLRPSSLDNLGLVPALGLLCNDAAETLGLPVHARLEPVQVAKEAELTIYRLVQESLTNIAKYAECREVSVTLGPLGEDKVQIMVEDDGRGFDPSAMRVGSHGLAGMRFRVESHAGRFDIRSKHGLGTVVTAELPARQDLGMQSMPIGSSQT